MMDDYDDYDGGYEYYHHPIYGWRRIGKTPSFSLQLIYLIFDILLLVFLFYCFYQTDELFFWMMLTALIVGTVVGVVIDNKLTKKKKAEQEKLDRTKMTTMMTLILMTLK